MVYVSRMIALATALVVPTMVWAHGDVAPQAVNTDALPDVGEEWLTENPYRAEAIGEDAWREAVQIGDSGYNQNCARCHGLGAVSGGLAPDLRYLEAEEYGDEWYAERFQFGMTQNGITKMPAFGEVLGQKAAWAIRTYIETRPDDGALDDYMADLVVLRDTMLDGSADAAQAEAKLTEIAGNIETASGAPIADSAVSRAARVLQKDPTHLKQAAETLTIGLSAAH
ncbi:cytochrome c-550 PedF [Thioclava sp. SK-1]|uniref:cytochrome c-550 PedF n=1 Tax=Thioclava sp. SK-1 TaxID=1889770 RepID=UPI000824D12A|nr:cytochrome c-550 PedF [Thioclava sp. SK-1]OCX62263.1 cytochrome c-550 PedF [Thioclava sp. SK-1]